MAKITHILTIIPSKFLGFFRKGTLFDISEFMDHFATVLLGETVEKAATLLKNASRTIMDNIIQGYNE